MKAEPIAKRLSYRSGFPVYLSRYVIFDDDERHVAMRFFNASEIGITGLRFVLTEKDEAGNVLTERLLERTGLFAERGSEFTVTDAVVGDKCAAVEARVEAALSEGYEYVADGKSVRLRYGTSKLEREVSFEQKATYSRSQKLVKYILIGLLAAFGFAVLAGGLAWRFGFFGTETGGAATAIVRTISEHVEAQ